MYNKEYTIVEKLGNGGCGTIYKIKIDSEYYALKKEKYIKSDIINFEKIIKNDKNILANTDKSFYRMIYFNKFINKINDIHFDKLYSYKISKANFKQIVNPQNYHMKTIINYYQGKYKSKYCLETIIDLKDNTLKSMFENKQWNNDDEIYSMIIQIMYALYLMHSNDFYHTDLHWGNIMYKKTNIKSIKILKLNIPTFGYIWSIIDYGDIESPLFENAFSIKRKLFIYRNLAYEDILNFIYNSIFKDKHQDVLQKMINNIKLSNIDIKRCFGELKYYKDAIKFIEYAANNDHIKIIKYYYSKLKN